MDARVGASGISASTAAGSSPIAASGIAAACGWGLAGAVSSVAGAETAACASDVSAAFAGGGIGTSGTVDGATLGGELCVFAAGACPAFDQTSTRFGTINLRQ
jgi:hypothetical protein